MEARIEDAHVLTEEEFLLLLPNTPEFTRFVLKQLPTVAQDVIGARTMYALRRYPVSTIREVLFACRRDVINLKAYEVPLLIHVIYEASHSNKEDVVEKV